MKERKNEVGVKERVVKRKRRKRLGKDAGDWLVICYCCCIKLQ